MTLTEWLNTHTDTASAVYDADPTLGHQVDMHNACVAVQGSAIRALDARVARLEAALGFDPFDLVPD